MLRNLEQTLKVSGLATLDQTQVQHALARPLRKAAINHLLKGKGVVAQGFQTNYLASKAGLNNAKKNAASFLKAQSKDGVWASYVEAAALGEMLGCNVVVTPVKNSVKQNPICLYATEDQNKAPTIELYNSNNTHWYVNGSTLGNGNCLYNAFAQAVQQVAKREQHTDRNIDPPVQQMIRSNPSTFFNKSSKEKEAIDHQKKIEEAIAKQSRPSDLAKQLQEQNDRINRLDPQEQIKVRKQIADDYLFALKLAIQQVSEDLVSQHSLTR